MLFSEREMIAIQKMLSEALKKEDIMHNVNCKHIKTNGRCTKIMKSYSWLPFIKYHPICVKISKGCYSTIVCKEQIKHIKKIPLKRK